MTMPRYNTMTFKTPRAVRKIERILALLETRACTREEICARLFMSHGSLEWYLRHLRKAGLIRIECRDYHAGGKRPVFMYRATQIAEDAPA